MIIKIAGTDTSKIIREDAIKSAMKSLFHNRTPLAIMKNFSKNYLYKDAILKTCVLDLKKEINHLVSKNCNIFKTKDAESMMSFKWSSVQDRFKAEAPSVYFVLSSIFDLQHHDHLPIFLASFAVLLYGQSRTVNQLQFILGIILDKCGLSKEVCMYM